jgi:hypothetical protein
MIVAATPCGRPIEGTHRGVPLVFTNSKQNKPARYFNSMTE